MPAKEKEEAKAETTELTIWVNLPDLDAKDFQLASSAYVSKLFAAIQEYMKFLNPQAPLVKLVVHTKDADNNLHLLDNAQLTLAEALCNSKCNSRGEYQVYVEAPTKGEAAGFDNLLDVAQTDPRVAEAKTTSVTDTRRPFVNRTREIQDLCCYLAKNIERCYSSEDQMVTKRKTLVLSTQMFGAGKTTLGSNFLLQLKKNPDHIAECKKFLGKEVREDAFTHLLSLQYALVDLRKIRVLADAHLALITKLMAVETAAGNYKKKQHPKLREALNFQNLKFHQIVRAFEAEFGHSYFVQFDDIGDLLDKAGLKGSAELLFDISKIQDNLTPKSLVYVTSRSPLFYLLGTDLLESSALKNWTSPSTAHSVVLDSLNADHILEMMTKTKKLDMETSRAIAETIFYRTGGVPRFVVGALDMLERTSPREWLASVKGDALFGELARNFGAELNCWQKVLLSDSLQTQDMAAELIRLAALHLPFALDEVLDPRWADAIKAQLPSSATLTLEAVPILLCSIFPLYVTRVPLEEMKEDLWRFVVPPICLEAIKTPHDRLPMQPIDTQNLGQYLEVLVRRCVRLRVSDSFIHTRGQPTSTLFPFLSGTLVGEEKMNCRGYARFPKLVKDESAKSEAELKVLMEDATKNDRQLPDVNRKHLPQLLEFMPRDMLSVPNDKSHSADLFYLTEMKHLIEWQMKAGDQVLQPADAVADLLKSSWQCIGTPLCSLTFIFVCLEGVSPKFFENIQASSETEYAFHFKPDSRFVCDRVCSTQGACKGRNDCVHAKAKPNEFVVPKLMEVLILKHAGLCCLLSEANMQAIANIRSSAKAQKKSPFAESTKAIEKKTKP